MLEVIVKMFFWRNKNKNAENNLNEVNSETGLLNELENPLVVEEKNHNEITEMYWERSNLHITFKEPVKEECCLKKGSQRLQLPYKESSVTISITNLEGGEMLGRGTYTLLVDDAKVILSDDIIVKIDDFSRNFKYKSKFYALLIDFKIDGKKYFYVESEYMMRNKKFKKLARFEERNGIKGKIIRIVKFFIPVFINFVYRFLCLFRRNKKKQVLFFTENDFQARGNLKVLYEHFLKLDNVKTVGAFINKYNGASAFAKIKTVYAISQSHYIVVDNYVSFLNILSLSEEQKVIQLWHAGVGFKAVGYARFGKVGSPHPFRSSHRKYNLVVVDGERLREVYSEVFAVPLDVVKPLGMPRLENYLSKERIETVVSSFEKENSVLNDKKIILFSPTFRGTTADNAKYDYSQLDLERIYAFCKENNFVFLVKMHPFVKKAIEIPEEFSDLIIDYSSKDINDLIYMSDIMITDYSSCAYEYSFFNRPLVFFRYDKILYEYLRPLHTLDVFTEKQFEALDFDSLMSVLEQLKDVKKEERFSNVVERENECCQKIAEEILSL